jgi:hypothetical protein
MGVLMKSGSHSHEARAVPISLHQGGAKRLLEPFLLITHNQLRLQLSQQPGTSLRWPRSAASDRASVDLGATQSKTIQKFN